MSLAVFGSSYQHISWMSVTMYESVLENHFSKNLYEIFGTFYRINAHRLNFLSIINFCTFDKLHCNNSLGTIFFVIFWDVDIWVLFEKLFCFDSIVNLCPKI